MQDSPYHEYGSVKFTISGKGIVDAEVMTKRHETVNLAEHLRDMQPNPIILNYKLNRR